MYNFDQLRDGNYYQGKSPLVTTLKLCSQYTGYFLRRPEKKTELIELNKTSIKIAKNQKEKNQILFTFYKPQSTSFNYIFQYRLQYE